MDIIYTDFEKAFEKKSLINNYLVNWYDTRKYFYSKNNEYMYKEQFAIIYCWLRFSA